jgi:hypothetical protein
MIRVGTPLGQTCGHATLQGVRLRRLCDGGHRFQPPNQSPVRTSNRIQSRKVTVPRVWVGTKLTYLDDRRSRRWSIHVSHKRGSVTGVSETEAVEPSQVFIELTQPMLFEIV